MLFWREPSVDNKITGSILFACHQLYHALYAKISFLILNLGGHWLYGLTIQELGTGRGTMLTQREFLKFQPRQLRKSTGVCLLEVLEVF